MEILGNDKVTDERWLNLFARTFRHGDHEGRWLFASRGDGTPPPPGHFDAVVIVPLVVAEGRPPRLCVVREYRVPVADYVYGFPAGLAEKGETPEAVARRELREETGLEVRDVLHVSPPVYSSAGMTDESAVMVFVTAFAPPGSKATLDRAEEIEVLTLDYGEVCALCDGGARFDGKAWMVLYLFRRLGRLE